MPTVLRFNEKFFLNPFKKNKKPNVYRVLYKKIYNYIVNNDIDITRTEKTKEKNDFVYYDFTIRHSVNNDIDPYGEDNWGSDLEIKLEEEDYLYRRIYLYRLYINGEKIKLGETDARAEKLFKLVDKKYEDKIENDTKNKIKRYNDLI